MLADNKARHSQAFGSLGAVFGPAGGVGWPLHGQRRGTFDTQLRAYAVPLAHGSLAEERGQATATGARGPLHSAAPDRPAPQQGRRGQQADGAARMDPPLRTVGRLRVSVNPYPGIGRSPPIRPPRPRSAPRRPRRARAPARGAAHGINWRCRPAAPCSCGVVRSSILPFQGSDPGFKV